MRALLALLAAAALAGCSVPLPGGEGVLLVHVRDRVAVHGTGNETIQGLFGPHCRHAQVEDGRLTLRHGLADAPPRALLVRSFELAAFGAAVPTQSADMTDHLALGPAPSEVRAPFAAGPVLAQAWTDGDAVRLGDQLLRPGENASISYSYTAEGDGDATLDVEETLVLRNLGRVPAALQRGRSCQ